MKYTKIKALKIYKHKCSTEIQNNSFSNNNTLHKYIIFPNNFTAKVIDKNKITLELKQLLIRQRKLVI